MTDRDQDILNFTKKDPIFIMDALGFILGEKLGEGGTRIAFDYAFDNNYVVKIAKEYPNDNINEWETWNIVKEDKELSKWFARCSMISRCGFVMIQRKTNPLKFLPDTLPNFFTDIKTSNFGKIGNQVVCHDYAFTNRRLWYYHKITMQKVK